MCIRDRFGALFGSFFGFEFESVIKPLDSMMTLPFLGEINIVLVAAFLFGSFIILTTMILNIATAIKPVSYTHLDVYKRQQVLLYTSLHTFSRVFSIFFNFFVIFYYFALLDVVSTYYI